MWFESLTGFREESPEQVRANIRMNGHTITSRVNGITLVCGHLETPTLAELRIRVKQQCAKAGRLTLKEVVGDASRIHSDPENAGAFFQVASQFNLLEMVSPSITPEAGVGIYENDPTQGPACAISAGAGTIFRNYFVEVNGQVGQSSLNQIDCLQDLGFALDNTKNQLWTMTNGYALPSTSGLEEISRRIRSMSEVERDEMRKLLRIGIQWNTQVTIQNCEHLVTQAYCSAMPVAYSNNQSPDLWADFAQLVLEASYEAAFCAALINSVNTGNNRVFLTLIGGGVFGNNSSWIFSAIRRAIKLFGDTKLEIAIVSHKSPGSHVQTFLDSL